MVIRLVAALLAVPLWLLPATLPATLPAQAADGSVAVKSGAKKTYDALVKELEVAMKKYRAESSALAKTPEYQEARKNRDRAKITALRSKLTLPLPKFVEHFAAAAKKYDGEPDVAYFHTWLATNSRDKKATLRELDLIEAKYLTSPAIKNFVAMMPRRSRMLGADRCNAFINKVIAANETDKLTVATALSARWTLVRYDRKATEEMKLQAEEDARRIQELAPGTTMALRAAAPAFEKAHLQIGMAVPDIEGEDLDGVKFKLSDYRGKVVVIDFWGDW